MEDLGTTIDGESTGNKRRGGNKEEAVVTQRRDDDDGEEENAVAMQSRTGSKVGRRWRGGIYKEFW